MLRISPIFVKSLFLSTCLVICTKVMVSPTVAEIAVNQSMPKIDGQMIASVTGKDLVHPVLSPDGKFLAYSEALMEKGRENTAVRILNLTTKQTTLLIDSKSAAKYKTYSSFVSRMTWSKINRLEVTISDGDVDSTTLTFNPVTKKLIRETANEPGLDPAITAQEKKTNAQIQSLFPEAQLDKAMSNRIALPGNSWIIAGDLFGNGENLWLFDLEKKSVRKLFDNVNPFAQADIISVGQTNQDAYLFSLQDMNSLRQGTNQRVLFAYDKGEIKKITAYTGSTPRIIHNSSNRTLLIGYDYPSYEKGNNPFYLFAKNRLQRINTYPELYDVNVNEQGTRLAYCYWQNSKRQIVVKEMIQG
jgi:hypothetical protein